MRFEGRKAMRQLTNSPLTHAGLTRRRFLKGSGAALAATLLPLGAGTARAGAASAPVLVTIYLRGAADGLNIVVPADDPAYYAIRPGISVEAGTERPLDGFFGLNPVFDPLLSLYQANELAFVQACGSPDDSRSHFDAQDYMERAAPGDPEVFDGWLNRAVDRIGGGESWSGISIGSAKALALAGDAPSLAFSSIGDFAFEGPAARRGVLERLYAASDSAPLASAGSEAFEALDLIGSVPMGDPASYPPGPFSSALADAAALIKADVGVRVLNVDIGGWDHHEGELGAMAGVGAALSGGLAAFRADLGAELGRTCVLVMTEFGRTAAENGNQGTDHGHGSIMMAMGAGVVGGRVLLKDGAWPGLGPGQLHQDRDLEVTTDFRDVFADVLHNHLGLSLGEVEGILPRHSVQAANFPGLFG